MTVAELKKVLEKYPGNYEVRVASLGDDMGSVVEVENSNEVNNEILKKLVGDDVFDKRNFYPENVVYINLE